MIDDPRMLRIDPPDEARRRLLRPAADVVSRALSTSWDNDGPEAALEGMAVMRPYTQWIGSCDTVVDEAHLRLLLDVLERCISCDYEHPHAASFPMDGPALALTMMLARLDDRPERSTRAVMLAEEPHPWGAPRLHQRDPRSRGNRNSESMVEDSDAENWSRLAPPAVRVFISDEHVGASGGRMPMTVSLIPVLHVVGIEELKRDPIARLRARAMLSAGGKERC